METGNWTRPVTFIMKWKKIGYSDEFHKANQSLQLMCADSYNLGCAMFSLAHKIHDNFLQVM